jgi:hypothetical protein
MALAGTGASRKARRSGTPPQAPDRAVYRLQNARDRLIGLR